MPIEDYREGVRSQKRRAALDAALASFLRQGYDSTTLQQIARDAGISTGTLFKHFPSKASLFEAIMEEMWESGQGYELRLPAPGDPHSGLVSLGRDYAERLRRPHTEPLFRIIIAEALRFPELGRALFEHGKVAYLERLNTYLRSEIDAGTLAIDDVPLAGRLFFGMINDSVFWPRFLATDLVFEPAFVETVIAEATATMLARFAVAGRRPA